RMALVSGKAIAPGAEYRTIPDTFQRIIANSADRLGPTSFTAYLKDGRVLTFDAVLDAPSLLELRPGPSQATQNWNKALLIPNPRRAWYLSRIEDRSGNTMEIEYQVATSPSPPGVALTPSVDLLPQLIRYTGFSGRGDGGPEKHFVKLFYGVRES